MTDVTIPALPAGVTLVGTEPLETVQANVSVKVPSRYFGLATDPVLLVGADAALTQSRTLTAGTGISLVDTGPGGTLTVSASGVTISDAQFVLLAAHPDLPNERVLTGTANQVIITDNGAGSTVVLSLPQSIAPASSPTFNALTLTTPLTVPNGGTGAATLTGVLQGNGASALTAISNSSTVGQVLRVTGAATYAWGALDLADSDAITGILPVPSGGTGAATLTGLLQGNGATAVTAIADSSTVGQVLRVTGAATYAWGAVDLADSDAITGNLPVANLNSGTGASSSTFWRGDGSWAAPAGGITGLANPSASVALSAVNGVATTAMRSDAAPALSQAISPTWTGTHSFTGALSTVIGTTQVTTGTQAAGVNPSMRLYFATGGADAKVWDNYADTNTLIYRTINDALNASANWQVVTRSGNAISSVQFPAGQVLIPDGTFGAPGLAFGAEPDVGIYRSATDTGVLAAGGFGVAGWIPTAFIMGIDGSVGTPVLSWSTDQDTGLYRRTTNVLGITAGGVEVIDATSTGCSILFGDGSVGGPLIAFFSDPDTGIYWAGSGTLAVTTNGASGFAVSNVGGGVVNVSLGNGTSSVLQINNVNAGTANAGGGTLPANPVGFIQVVFNGTVRKIPYYAN